MKPSVFFEKGMRKGANEKRWCYKNRLGGGEDRLSCRVKKARGKVPAKRLP